MKAFINWFNFRRYLYLQILQMQYVLTVDEKKLILFMCCILLLI